MATIKASLKSGTAVDIRSRQFLWRSDEPPEAGGANSGPTPYEFLLGSFAACMAMTLRLYATQKNIPLAGVDVILECDRVHSDDCVNCDGRPDGLVNQIESQITVYGDLTSVERDQLLQVARRCPVHKTLEHGLQITDTVTFST